MMKLVIASSIGLRRHTFEWYSILASTVNTEQGYAYAHEIMINMTTKSIVYFTNCFIYISNLAVEIIEA